MRNHPTALSGALGSLKAAVLGGLLALLVVAGLHGADESSEPRKVADAYSRVTARAMSDQRCSTSGFEAVRVPRSALVRTAQGKLKVVSFAQGWKVYNGKAPGRLVAVCLDGR